MTNATHRHDLREWSCVNNEVKSFNNKLKNKLGNICNSKLVCIDSSRRYFTRHGLHMNGLGKEVLALKITEEVKRFTHSKEKPIPLTWMEDTAGVNGLPNES